MKKELAYLVEVSKIPLYNKKYDLDIIIAGDNKVISDRGLFKEGDVVVYIKCGSRLPKCYPWTTCPYLIRNNFKVKSFRVGKEKSHGFLVSLSKLNWSVGKDVDENILIRDHLGGVHRLNDSTRDVTELLKIKNKLFIRRN